MLVVFDARVYSPVSQRLRVIGVGGVLKLEPGFRGGRPADRVRVATTGGLTIRVADGVSACGIEVDCPVDVVEEKIDESLSVKLETDSPLWKAVRFKKGLDKMIVWTSILTL